MRSATPSNKPKMALPCGQCDKKHPSGTHCQGFKLTAPKKPPKYEKEWAEQRKLFDYAKAHEATDPRWKLLNASMNGLQVGNPAIIVRAKLCGLRPGYPDAFLPVAKCHSYPNCGRTFGMFVEIKRKHKNWVTNNWDCCASDDQRWWRDRLLEQGYEVRLAHGGDEAIAMYEAYLKGNG